MLKLSLVLRHKKKTSTRYPVYLDVFIQPGRGFILILLSHPAGILFEFIYSVRDLKKYEQSCGHNDGMVHVFL